MDAWQDSRHRLRQAYPASCEGASKQFEFRKSSCTGPVDCSIFQALYVFNRGAARQLRHGYRAPRQALLPGRRAPGSKQNNMGELPQSRRTLVPPDNGDHYVLVWVFGLLYSRWQAA